MKDKMQIFFLCVRANNNGYWLLSPIKNAETKYKETTICKEIDI